METTNPRKISDARRRLDGRRKGLCIEVMHPDGARTALSARDSGSIHAGKAVRVQFTEKIGK
jgi:hypothetical protein